MKSSTDTVSASSCTTLRARRYTPHTAEILVNARWNVAVARISGGNG